MKLVLPLESGKITVSNCLWYPNQNMQIFSHDNVPIYLQDISYTLELLIAYCFQDNHKEELHKGARKDDQLLDFLEKTLHICKEYHSISLT